MADLLCDASSLISLTRNCFSSVLPYLHTNFRINFFISEHVEKEIITHPLNIKTKQYALSAMRLKDLMNKKYLTRIDADIHEKSERILKIANNIFFAKGQPLNIIHLGEVELIALSEHLNLDTLLIDERTTRMLIESPFLYKKHLEKEFKVNIMVNKQNFSLFQNMTQNIKIIRSSELLILAYENGMLDNLKNLKNDMLSAALYGLKYSGCSIKFSEIEKFIKNVN
ncbi:MAG: hypothetical protein PHU63_01415 [Candidatus ainarchaeum sp.]|nr:hypothetical protein [Candidatus ainarchaeum sp.]